MINKYKYLILIFATIIFLVPRPALALWGVGDFGLFDIPDQILGGIEEKTGPIFTAVTSLLIVYMVGLTALELSGEYLQKFISQQDSMITALEPMTQAGWSFMAGLANMLLVLIFLIIAFAFILKIENFQAKKTLPRLIIVALLINFSYLFVQVLIDLSQIVYNTVLPETPIFSMVMEALTAPGESVLGTILTWITSIGVSLAIPMGNALTQILLSSLFTVFLLPNIIIWIVQAVFFWLLTAMLFSFAFLFAARVFILQILMILSPLAFVCLILPQTLGFWKKWYKFLTDWLVAGIFFLFFLTLGFGALTLMKPNVDTLPIPGAAAFRIGGSLVYYFIVLIYMGVILFIGKQFIPQGAQEIINFAKGIAGTVMTRGLSPIGKSLKERTLPLAKEELAQSERVRDIAKRLATAGNPRAKIAAPIWALGRSMGRAGLGTMEDTKNNVSRLKAQAEKIETPEMLLSKYLSARTKSERLAYLSTAIKKGKPFKKVFEKILDPKDVQDIKKRQKNDPTVKLTAEEKQRVKNFDDFKNQTIATTKMANDIGSIPDAERIMRAFLHLEEGRKNKDDLIGKMGFKPLEGNDIKKYDGSLSEKYIAEAKGDEIKDFNKNLWKMTEAQEAILKHWTGEKVGSAGREFHDDFLDAFRGMFKKEEDGGLHDAINILNGNKNIYNYLSSSPAQGLGLSMKEINPELEKTSKEKVEIYSGSEEDFRAAKKDRDDREALKNKERNK